MNNLIDDLYTKRFSVNCEGNIGYCECGSYHHIACCFKGKDR
jgi:hypothetical protein